MLNRAGLMSLKKLGIVGVCALSAACSDDPAAKSDVVDATDATDAIEVNEVEGDVAQETAEVETPGNPLPQALRDELQGLVDDNLVNTASPGIEMTVVVPPYDPWTAVSGLASTEDERAVVVGDQFRIGSISKMFTAAVALLAVEDGLVALDEDIDGILPGYDFGAGVTLRSVLDHTAGIFNYTDDIEFLNLRAEPWTADQIVRWAMEHGPVFAPGDGWSYSNTGYYIAAMVVEEVTGKSFVDNVRTRILDPLALRKTYTTPGEEALGDLVEGYAVGTNVTDELKMEWAWAAMGMVSDTNDMCRWAKALLDGEVLSDAMLDAMLDKIPLTGEDATGYGLGARFLEIDGRELVGHTGSTMGFNSNLFIDPTTGICISTFVNDFFGNPEAVSDLVWRAILDGL